MISGMLHRNRKHTHAIRKAPAPVSPPLWAAILGNLQILPVPTATPSALNIKPILEENLWSVDLSIVLFILIQRKVSQVNIPIFTKLINEGVIN
jgi:hypothetical protein